MQIAEDAYM